jgi:dipeptide transport system ATP-binding protein
MALLEIDRLRVEFGSVEAPLAAVDDVTLAVDAGETVGVAGESGSGKSVAALAVMGLVDFPGRVRAGRLRFDDRELIALTARERRALAGRDLAMIFQDPIASLDPSFTVGFQFEEVLRAHGTAAEKARSGARLRRARALDLLRQVEIPDPALRLAAYPHQLSGGMAQRVMIAIAIACRPRLLIADEPTTALDVTVQAQILALLSRLQAEQGMAILLISHDLALLAQHAQRVVVLYAGQVVESGAAESLFAAPRHPYTQALLAAAPERNLDRARLRTLAGTVPALGDRPRACRLAPRCAYAVARCRTEAPALEATGTGVVRCHFPLGHDGRPGRGWVAEESHG